jgi:membrane carboxypeptidase/penicillin-binding protein
MDGGFSYPLSQLNRVTQAQRQPGSALKPLSYLAALENGLEPNTLIRDEPITLAPINRRGEEWAPKNYEGGGSGILTLRQALENSRNLATAHLLEGGIAAKPEQSLDRLCALALEMAIYRDCVRFYPFILGAQPVRPIDLAAFYAAIANEGVRVTPHVVEAIEQGGKTYRRDTPRPAPVSAPDRAAFYQLKSMLQGVVKRGTAHALAPLAPYMAGKTGTTEDENDAWFVGFTNEITVAVWVGYDNPGDTRRTLGDGATGAAVAAPITQSIIEAAWSQGMSKTPLAPPSAEAMSRLSCKPRDFETSPHGRSTTECLRLDAKGKPIEARHRLVLRENSSARPNRDDASSRATRPPSAIKPPSDQPSPAVGYNWFDWWGGWGRDHQPGSQMQPRGF